VFEAGTVLRDPARHPPHRRLTSIPPMA